MDEIDRTVQVRSGEKTCSQREAFSQGRRSKQIGTYFVNVVNLLKRPNKLVYFSCTNSNGLAFSVFYQSIFRVYRATASEQFVLAHHRVIGQQFDAYQGNDASIRIDRVCFNVSLSQPVVPECLGTRQQCYEALRARTGRRAHQENLNFLKLSQIDL